MAGGDAIATRRVTFVLHEAKITQHIDRATGRNHGAHDKNRGG